MLKFNPKLFFSKKAIVGYAVTAIAAGLVAIIGQYRKFEETMEIIEIVEENPSTPDAPATVVKTTKAAVVSKKPGGDGDNS